MKKIYYGKNKKEITLKELIMVSLRSAEDHTGMEHIPGRFSDGSASWINVRKLEGNAAWDIEIDFDPNDDNAILDFKLYKSEVKTIIDEENQERVF